MLLCIDIGNTNIVLGVFFNDKLVEKYRLSTDERKTEDEYAVIIKSFLHKITITHSIISSVVPNLNNTIKKLIIKYYGIKPLVVTKDLKMNIKLKYPNPTEIGADRIVNAVAAIHLYKSPLVIVDFGTATTFCYIDRDKCYHGGLILPGIPLMLRALHLGTAKLPEIEIKKPANLIGRNTVESIQAGVYFQTVGAINSIMKRLRKEYDSQCKLIFTGGFGKLFDKDIKPSPIINPDLTLIGLSLLHALNKKQ